MIMAATRGLYFKMGLVLKAVDYFLLLTNLFSVLRLYLTKFIYVDY